MRILFFAQAAELAGCREEILDSAAALSIEELWRDLISHHPRLAPLRPGCRIAINRTYADSETRIPPDAEVAIIPPVSGG